MTDTYHRIPAETIATNEDGVGYDQVPSTNDVSSPVSTDNIDTTAYLQPKQEEKANQHKFILFSKTSYNFIVKVLKTNLNRLKFYFL